MNRAQRKLRYLERRRQPLRTYDSELLTWMGFANAGMLDPGHRVLIDQAVRELPTADPVVEIGAFCGLSTNVLTYFLQKYERPNRLFSSDPWIFEGENAELLPESTIPFPEYRDLVRRQFEQNVRFWSRGRLPHALELGSDDFFAAWGRGEEREDVFGRPAQLGGPISFCFIDGDHRHDQAQRDFEHADSLLVPGGFLLFDDADEFGAFPHLHELVQNVLHEGRYELAGENPAQLLRKRA